MVIIRTKLPMPDAVVILLTLQLVVLLALVAGIFWMGKAAKDSLDKATALIAQLQDTLENDLKPTMKEARAAIARAEEAATLAANALTSAAPAVNTVSQLVGKVEKSVSPLWLDAARLAFGIIGAVKSRKKKKEDSEEGEA